MSTTNNVSILHPADTLTFHFDNALPPGVNRITNILCRGRFIISYIPIVEADLPIKKIGQVHKSG